MKKKVISIILCAILAVSMIAVLAACEPDPDVDAPITYVVAFDLNYAGATDAPALQTIERGNKAAEPATVPSRAGYRFLGWYRDAEGDSQFSFSSSITGNITLYASWEKLPEVYIVTFDLNYADATNAPAPQTIVEGNKAARPASNPVRSGYTFQDWSTEAGSLSPFNFNTVITKATTLYAYWTDDSVGALIVTFDLGYSGATNSMQHVRPNGAAVKITEPIRPGYKFSSWYTDESYTAEYNFAASVITGPTTIYALWQAIFEAEYTNLDGKTGQGYSGNPQGKDIIIEDDESLGASNGCYVSYLYRNGITLTFDFVSDRAASNVSITLRLSSELENISLNGNNYKVTINGVAVNYTGVTLSGTTGSKSQFTDFTITTTASLVSGNNKIELITNNTKEAGEAAGYLADAPLVDCVKVDAKAKLSWTPKTSNIG